MSAFRIKKRFIIGLATWLNLQSLAGRESRERTKFVDILADAIRELERDRQEIIGRYAAREDDGSLKKAVDNGAERFVIPDDKKADMEREYADLINEEFVLDIGEGHKQKIRIARDIVLNTDYKFGPADGDGPAEAEAKIRQANDYVEWCDAFDKVEL